MSPSRSIVTGGNVPRVVIGAIVSGDKWFPGVRFQLRNCETHTTFSLNGLLLTVY